MSKLIYTGYAWRPATLIELEIMDPSRELKELPETPVAGNIIEEDLLMPEQKLVAIVEFNGFQSYDEVNEFMGQAFAKMSFGPRNLMVSHLKPEAAEEALDIVHRGNQGVTLLDHA